MPQLEINLYYPYQYIHLLCLYLAASSFGLHAHMQIVEHCTHLFAKDRVPTEGYAYACLKENSVSVPVTYLAVPWGQLIKTKKLHTVPKNLPVSNGFTICHHICFEQIIPILKQLGVAVLFTPHVVKKKEYKDITVLPFPHYPVNGIPPSATKDIYYSFIGFISHPVRNALFRLPTHDDVIIKKRKKWHFYGTDQNEKKEYQNVLARSRFSLCPRGTGASTVRFWESLQAGAIPILISDAMVLPDFIDWDGCIVRVPELKVHTIPELLASISKEQECDMRKRCIEVFDLFFGRNFASCIHAFYNQNH